VDPKSKQVVVLDGKQVCFGLLSFLGHVQPVPLWDKMKKKCRDGLLLKSMPNGSLEEYY
jgi:hypothetical protein